MDPAPLVSEGKGQPGGRPRGVEDGRMAARQTRRQLQFTGFEMGMIAVSFVVTVTAVFFLGLFVGKKNASWHAPAEDRVARVPVDDFTRYKRPAPIEKPVREPKPVETVASASGAAPSGPAGPAAHAAAPAAEAAKTAAAAVPAAPAAAPAPAVPAATESPKPAATDAAAKDAAAKEAAKAKELAAAKEAAAKEAAAKKAKEEKEKEAEAPTGKGYTVQILATRKQADAEALVQKLKSRGYGAYIKKVSNGEDAWYRVRVGSYGAFGEAKGMADKCRRDLGLGQAFVSTE